MGEGAGHVGAVGGAGPDPDAIAEDIERTRTGLTGTIEAIQDRLAPEVLTDQAVGAATEVTEQARDAAKEVAEFAIGEAKMAVRDLAEQASSAVRGATVGRVEQVAAQTRDAAQQAQTGLFGTIKQHPIPAAMAAIGIGWLWTHRSGAGGEQTTPAYGSGGRGGYTPAYGRGYGYGAAYGEYDDDGYAQRSMGGSRAGSDDERGGQRPLEATGQAVGQAAEQAQHAAGQVVGQAAEQVHHVAERAQQATGQVRHQAQGTFWQMLEANPLAVGALGAVVGGAAALLLPETEQENRLLGEARDRVVERVQEVTGEAVDKVEQVTAEVGGSVQEAAAEVGQTAARAAREQGLTVEGDASSGA